MKWVSIGKRILAITVVLFLSALLLGAGGQQSQDISDRVRAYTRNKEFDFTQWTLDAIALKLRQMASGSENYLTDVQRHGLVVDYLKLILQIQMDENKLQDVYADPNIRDPKTASQDLRQELNAMYGQRTQMAPVAEAILQDQIGRTASEFGLTMGGQPIPPVLYHATPLPWALIVSPRNAIRQEADINLVPTLTIDQHAALEDQVDRSLDVSSLVVGIGGIGLYPTMVSETFDLNWLSEVISHEWTHNFLTLRPLGVSYLNSSELRTMNETTASIAGKELGKTVIEKYYPELLPEPETAPANNPASEQNLPPAFDFNKEMHITRVEVDRLLAEGKVDEAEKYMEQQRVMFWNNGYHIRKLNQAWFAFHGAYADQPGGGAAGEDPVGAAVRALRAQSASLADFLNRISWMSSFEQLQRAVDARGK